MLAGTGDAGKGSLAVAADLGAESRLNTRVSAYYLVSVRGFRGLQSRVLQCADFTKLPWGLLIGIGNLPKRSLDHLDTQSIINKKYTRAMPGAHKVFLKQRIGNKYYSIHCYTPLEFGEAEAR